MQKKIEYRRNLPHINPENAVFFITYRLAGSIPRQFIDKYLNQKKETASDNYFTEFDDYLDKQTGHLHHKEIAKIIEESLNYYNKKQYGIIAYCIMPNHVHILINTNNFPYRNLFSIMKSIKGVSARKINKLLNKKGQFWHHESYDRMVRDRNELANTIAYIKNNPVKAGLVQTWGNWDYTYVDKKYIDE